MAHLNMPVIPLELLYAVAPPNASLSHAFIRFSRTMPSFKKWLREKLPWKKEETVLTKPPLPFLPTKRQNILTPSPSQENLVSSMDNYGIFHRLPLEIRCTILIEAFGGRTLHMDLTPGSGLAACVTDLIIGRMKVDTAVCIHTADGCLSGVVDGGNSECGPAGEEDKCFISVMGWLLACRQAYVDGIDVLFATNSFHIGSSDLLEHLPSLLLHQRLSRIQSLEIIWKGRTRVEGTSSPIHSLCQMVPQALPHVRQLAIFFRSSIGETRGIHFADFPDPAMVGPIEDMIRALGPGREFNVSIELRLSGTTPVLRAGFGRYLVLEMSWVTGFVVEDLATRNRMYYV
ncbi:hypothetical protein V496_10631 [Pseudogymnoascus sp. VKM F-4515 (FW-2607)]|nr:hypothetical protein V496_10631 [Pseudogymnoascus sp. VKM F-4515 (FW-2607)]